MKIKILGILGIILALTSTAFAGTLGTITFGSVDGTGYITNVCVDDVVFIDGNPGLGAYQAADGNWIVKNDEGQLMGSKIFVLGTQEIWRGGKRAADVDVSNALGSATLVGQSVALKLRHSVNAKDYYAVLIFLVEMPNGQRGWFVPFASEQFIVKNKLGEAQTLAVVSKTKGQVLAPDQKGKDMAYQRE